VVGAAASAVAMVVLQATVAVVVAMAADTAILAVRMDHHLGGRKPTPGLQMRRGFPLRVASSLSFIS